VIGVGVVGYGYWGPNLVRNFAETTRAKVVAVCDIRPDILATVGRRYPSVRATGVYADLLHDAEIDAIVVATPVRSHFELALAALEAGKHVLLEKPMTETAEQAKRLIGAAQRHDLTLMVDHTFVYTPAIRMIRELISSGDIGRIYYYDSVRVNLGLFQNDVNIVWDLAVHDFSILDYILSERPVGLSASGGSPVKTYPESIAFISLFFASGMIAHVNVNWLAPVKVRQTLIGGSRKMIMFNELAPSEKVRIYDKGVTITDDPQKIFQMRVGYRTGDMLAPQLSTREALAAEVDHFIDCIEGRRTPDTSGQMGLHVIELLEAASRSMNRRGQPIDLPG
jgi:predicted dehydrogenase